MWWMTKKRGKEIVRDENFPQWSNHKDGVPNVATEEWHGCCSSIQLGTGCPASQQFVFQIASAGYYVIEINSLLAFTEVPTATCEENKGYTGSDNI